MPDIPRYRLSSVPQHLKLDLSTLSVAEPVQEAHDMMSPTGRALVGMLAVFAELERDILRDRVKAGIAQARKLGKPHGRPPTVRQKSEEIKQLYASGVSKREIAKRLSISRTEVRRLLGLSAN